MKRLAAAALNVELKSSTSLQELEMKILNTPVTEFDPINLSTAISQLAKQQSTNHRAVDRIVQMSTELKFPPRELSTFCHGIARGKFMTQLPAFILQQIREQKFTSAFDLSITMWSAAKLNHVGMDSVLARQIEEEIDWMRSKPQDIANTAWALAVFDNRDTGKRFAHIVAKRTLGDFNSFDLSNLAWSFAKLHINEQWEGIYARALQIDWTLSSSQDVSNMLWAMAMVSSQNRSVLNKITSELERMDWMRFKPKELVNIVWALATLSPHNNHIVLTLAEFLVIKRNDVTRGQDLASILWSLASISNNNSSGLLPTICQRIIQGRELIPQEIATISWAVATLLHYDSALMRALAERTVQNVDQFNAQDITNTVWAFAKLGHYSRVLMDAVADEVGKRNRKDFETRALINILWSFATLRHSHAKLCQQISNALLLPRGADSSLSLQDMSNVMYSFALLNCKNRELFAVIAKQARIAVEQQQQQVRSQDLFVLMWSFACCNVLRMEAVEQFFQVTTSSNALLSPKDCTVQSANQLHQCSLAWNDAHYGDRSKLIDSIDGAWVYAARTAVADTIFSSKTHISITQELREHFDPEQVVMETFVNGISVDILLPALRTVVEIDGPQHFFANEHETRTGKTLFKLRLLKAAGFQVLSVPVLHSLGHAEHGKTVQKLIQTLLQAAKRQQQQQPVL